jgi:hypothetical protein
MADRAMGVARLRMPHQHDWPPSSKDASVGVGRQPLSGPTLIHRRLGSGEVEGDLYPWSETRDLILRLQSRVSNVP